MSLQTKRTRFRATGTLPMLGSVSIDTSELEASYRIAFRVAKEKNPHTIEGMTYQTLYYGYVEVGLWKRRNLKKLEKISLSIDTVRCRKSDMSRDSLDQVADEI